MPAAVSRTSIRRARTLRRRAVAISTVVALAAGAAVGGVASVGFAASGQVTGFAFRDFNQNGVFDTTVGADGITDSGLADTTVRAFDASGALVGTATSTADGSYALAAPSVADGTPLRIEFTAPGGYYESASGTGNGTSVQFTTLGATGVDYGAHAATDFSRGNRTPIVTAVNANGASTPTGANASARALTAVLPATAVNTANRSVANTLATFGEVGAIWGTAVQPLGDDRYAIWASAVLKRHSGFGPQGIAGLYRIEVSVAGDGTVTRTGLNSFALDSGANSVDYGAATRDLMDRGGSSTIDAAAFSLIGEVGIGGLAYDGGRLFVTNLADRSVYSYDVNDIAAAPQRVAVGVGPTERPWAVAVHDGRLYVGAVDTASPAEGSRLLSAPVGSASIAQTDLKVPLDYQRGVAWDRDNPVTTTGQPNLAWHAWRDFDSAFESDAQLPGNVIGMFRAWAQPILSGIAFDESGNVSLAYTDRFSLQGGAAARWPSGTALYTAIPGGDLLFAGRTKDGFALESNGSVTATGPSGAVTTRTRSLTAPGNTTVGAGQTARAGIQGPGGREFYEDSVRWNGAGGIGGEGVVHDETVLGSTVIVPGTNQIATTSYDSANAYNVGGNRWLSTTDGHSVNGFDQYSTSETAYFRKAGGLGNIAALLADAPVEIGNRVWFDADRDGIQDADEPAIQGAGVELLDETGTNVLATTTTGAAGTYSFNSATTGALNAFSNYRLRFSRPASATATLVGADAGRYAGIRSEELELTAPGAGGQSKLDSDVDPVSRTVAVATAGWGMDNHTFDAGFVRKTYAIGDVAWVDSDENGLQDEGEPALAGVLVRLLDAAGTSELARANTDVDGRYLFDLLPANSYVLEFSQPAGYFRTTRNATVESAPAPDRDSDAAVATGRTVEIKLGDSSVSSTYSEQPFLASEGVDPAWDAGYVAYEPEIEVTKADSEGRTANSLGSAVDVAPNGGAAKLVFTVENTGNEPLTDVNVSDVQATGSSGSVSALTCLAPDSSTAVTLPWAGPLQPESSMVCTADLTGVKAGTPHLDTVTVTGTGATTKKVVDDDDPFNAVARTYALGDRVWVDQDEDGLQDDEEEEPGRAGVTVTLLDASGAPIAGRTAVTDRFGRYLFDDLVAGTYRVRFDLPADSRWTLQEGRSTSADSDADAQGVSAPIVLGPTNTSLTPRPGISATEGIDPSWDAGIVPFEVAVGDFVWVDRDGDGIQDAGEEGLPGVTVRLEGPGGAAVTDVYGSPVSPVTTDGTGAYLFTGLAPLPAGRHYTVRIDEAASASVLAPYKPSPAGAGADRAADSSTSSAESGDLTTDGAQDRSLDFGFVPLAPAIVIVKTDAAGADANTEATAVDLTGADGATTLKFQVRNTGEEPLTDIAVTDAVTVGDAAVADLVCTFPGGATGTTWGGPLPLDGKFDCTASLSGVEPAELHTDVAKVTAKGAATGAPVEDTDPFHAIVRPAVQVGDLVFEDVDRDGIQDPGEPGIAGVWLELIGPNGASVQNVLGSPVAAVQTGTDGRYAFADLPVLTEGQGYTVRIDRARSASALAAFLPAPAGQGGDRGADSSTDTAQSTTLTADGQSDMTLDFGFVRRTYAIGDRVWIDTDRDGVQDSEEPPLSDVTVTLYGTDGREIDSVRTDEKGLYLFDELLPGEYQVGFDLGAARRPFRLTSAGAGDDRTADSDAAVDTGRTGVFALGAETVTSGYTAQKFGATEGIDSTRDAGVVLRDYAVGSRAWFDLNGNGQQDAGEPSVPGITVALLDSKGAEIARTVTDANGHYRFDRLPAGRYALRFVLSDELRAQGYRFTTELKGPADTDSDADREGLSPFFDLGPDNTSLILTGDESTGVLATEGIDPTWNVGIVKDAPVVVTVPAAGPKAPGLASTGADVPWLFGLVAALLSGMGAFLILRGRYGRRLAGGDDQEAPASS